MALDISNDPGEEMSLKEQVKQAIAAIVVGGQNYQIGSRSLTRANLAELRAMLRDLEAQDEQTTDRYHYISTARFDGR